MANVFIEESVMSSIGNAIRSKTGKADMILPKDMASEIEGIESSGNTELINSVINGTVTDICIDTPVRNYAFFECNSIKPTFGDNCTRIGFQAFCQCKEMTEISTNKVTTIGMYAFKGAKNLTKADLPNVIKLQNYAFDSAKLETLILRSNKLCALEGTAAFNKTPIANGEGYIYVPKDLLEDYKVATNWIKFANQFRAIEDYPEITGGN